MKDKGSPQPGDKHCPRSEVSGRDVFEKHCFLRSGLPSAFQALLGEAQRQVPSPHRTSWGSGAHTPGTLTTQAGPESLPQAWVAQAWFLLQPCIGPRFSITLPISQECWKDCDVCQHTLKNKMIPKHQFKKSRVLISHNDY